MVDDNFRSYRSRDPLPREAADRAAGDPADPLAELARLIGQTDPYAEAHRNETHSGRLDTAAPQASEQDWAADEDQAEEYADDRYVPPPLSATPREPRYDDEQPSNGPYYSGPARAFGGFRDEPESNYRNESVPAMRPRDLPAYAASEREEDFAEADHEGEQSYEQDDDYYDDRPAPRRRGAVVVIMAVLGLAVIGTAGAFAYRTMFGGSMLPSLPPIIKASIGPNRITPSAPAANQSQTAMANSAAAETLVPREEQPVSIEPPKTPRVISTIPVVGGQSMAQPGMMVGQPPSGIAPNVQSSSPWPPPPPMPNAMPNQAPAPAPPTASAAPASTPAPTGGQPRRIHTVTIRSDQAAAADASAMPPPSPPPAAAPAPHAAPAPRVAPRPASNPPRPTAAVSTPANAPLSIVPGGQGGAAPAARAPAAIRPISVASAGPATEAAPVRGGHYAVQVSSQRSEAEAQASFRELRAKFPTQLGGREPMIRRADLGSKGTYYRALVGPFASAEQAAEMCSGLKAAGGTCLVQKN